MTSADLLRLIASAAKAGERCPKRKCWAFARLIRDKWIESRTYGRNWRVVKIVKGEFSGLETLASPCGSEPWLVSNAGGVSKRSRTHKRRAKPSEPRVLTSEEIER